MQTELYKEDFLQERKAREKAYSMKEEMRLACDQTLHAKTIELEELRLASEEIIERLSKQVEDTSEDRDQIKEVQEACATRSRTKQHQLRQQLQEQQEDIRLLREQLQRAHQETLQSQQEIQAKTAQVKQYKKKDDQREEKVTVYFIPIVLHISWSKRLVGAFVSLEI